MACPTAERAFFTARPDGPASVPDARPDAAMPS